MHLSLVLARLESAIEKATRGVGPTRLNPSTTMKTSLPCLLIVSLGLSLPQMYGAELVFFGNLHSHTSYSDGSGTPEQAYKYARDTAKVDFLAITEHNHRLCEGGAAADRRDGVMIAKNPELYTGPKSSALIPTAGRYNQEGKFLAIYGQEFSSISQGNHANVFEIAEVIDDQVVPNGHFDSLLTWLGTHLDSTGQKAIIQFNHAKLLDDYTIQYGADDFGGQANWLSQMGEETALFEMLNGPAMTKTSGNRSEEVMEEDYNHYLLLGFHVAPTGDQDNHYKTWGNSTDSRTGVIADELTKPKLLAALRARHAYATEDKNLRLIFKVNGHLCGDIVPAPPPGTELEISYAIQDDDEPDAAYQIEVNSGTIGGNAVQLLDTVSTTGNTTAPKSIADIQYAGGPQFIYFKITQANNDGVADRAWTAPVWFESSPEQPVITGNDSNQYIASKNSSVYHVSPECRSAKSIKESNRITGAAAKEGRTKHQGCPIS